MVSHTSSPCVLTSFNLNGIELKIKMNAPCAMKLITVAAVLFSIASCSVSVYEASSPSYLVITDYLSANTGADLSDQIQRVIDEHPNRTIYFPDGKYCISKPILTPADPDRSVSLSLSNYAHIMPVDASKWKHDEAMIRLGGKLPANKIAQAGSLYFSGRGNHRWIRCREGGFH